MVTGSNISRPGFPAAKALIAAAAVLAGVFGILIFFVFDPTKVSLFPPCLFHQWTGLDCPGCGGQRALHELLHGNLIAAIRLNAMFVFSLPLFGWLIPRWLWRARRGEPISSNSKWWWAYVAAWLLFGVLRNLPVPMLAWFAA
jgi:Protein of unknown function (DUF2752)